MPDELLCGKSGISKERDKNRKQPAGVSVNDAGNAPLPNNIHTNLNMEGNTDGKD